MRYAVYGQTTVDVTAEPTGPVFWALGRAVTTGRVFWLRGMYYIPCGTDAQMFISDGTTGDDASDMTVKARFAAVTEGGSPMGQGLVNLPAPGLKFSTGVVVSLGSSSGYGCTGGAIRAGFIGGWGYEE